MNARLVIAVGSLLAACGGGAREPLGSASQALDVANGDQLNGDQLNGDQLNGDQLNGDQLNGTGLGTHLVSVAYAGARINGVQLDGVSISGSQLTGWKGWHFYSGGDFASASFQGLSDTGAAVTLRLTSAARDASPNDDTWLYGVEYRDDVNDRWWALCRDGAGNAVPAIAVAGRWNYAHGVPGGGGKISDPAAFTFACKGLGAIGKCISPIGYAPWRRVNGTRLDRHHQACVRLIRADFCGDGTSYTVDGNHVNIYDGVGVQRDDQLWLIEAEWDERGARCFNPLNRSHALVPCFLDRSLDLCGAPWDFWTGTLLMNETPPLSLLP